jgi:glycosyltransferase involved in cell wall biosynthesis
MSRIHFVGSISPFEEVSNSSVSIAGNRCQIGILDGLKKDNEIVQVLSYRANRLFPYTEKIYVPSLHLLYKELNFIFLPYLNLPFFRAWLVNLGVIFLLFKKVKKHDSLLFYNLYLPFPISVFILRKLFDIKIYVLACDVHIPGQTIPNTLRWQYEYLKHKLFLPKVDGVIAVTEKILFDFRCTKKNIVMEGGISRDLLTFDDIAPKSAKTFNMFYAGALDKLNGVDLLIDAFSRNTNTNIRLIIAGKGELREFVEKSATKDNRIEFLGLISHAEIIKLYAEVSMLLCIRVTKEINTGYFFPSKLVEYISTGIPVLCTDIKSSNFDLNDFCFVIKDETVDAIGIAINECISNYELLVLKSRRGKLFVRQEMMWDVQGKKISALINN